jgi:hypothetical protein
MEIEFSRKIFEKYSNVRNSHIVICGLSGSTIFFHTISKNVIEHKMYVLIFSKAFVWNIAHFKKNWARYDQISTLVFMSSTRYSCQVVMKLEFSWQIFEKY